MEVMEILCRTRVANGSSGMGIVSSKMCGPSGRPAKFRM